MAKRAKPFNDAKLHSNLHLSLEALENDVWDEPSYKSAVVKASHRLRKKPLQDLSDEELRLALSQQIGLPWTAALAVDRLSENAFRQGDFYPGDLLIACLRLPDSFWTDHSGLRARLGSLAMAASQKLSDLSEPADEAVAAALNDFTP